MKKFGRKLVLSGLALAATAATLSTSTYAWYVSNNEATVDGGTAATTGGTVGGNLLVAANEAQKTEGVITGYAAGDYSNKATLNGKYVQSATLDPVTKYDSLKSYYTVTTDTAVDEDKEYYTYNKTNKTYEVASDIETFAAGTTYFEEVTVAEYFLTKDTALNFTTTYYTKSGDPGEEVYTKVDAPNVEAIGTYYEKTAWIDANGNPVSQSKAYQEVSFWVLNTNTNDTVTVTTTLTNVTTAFNEQRLLNTTGAPTAAQDEAVEGTETLDINDLFHVDAAEALRFEVTVQELVGGTLEAPKSTTVYDAKTFTAGTYTTKAGCTTGGDSNAYYYAMLGSYPVAGNTVDAPTVNFENLVLTQNVETKITIRIWLEGSDAQCFDSCKGQNFTFDFDLEV